MLFRVRSSMDLCKNTIVYIATLFLSICINNTYADTPNTLPLIHAKKDTDNHLEVVMVTAQKRPQNVISVPISMSVIDADIIEKNGSQNISEAINGVANLSFDNKITLAGNSAASSIYIRGIGQSDFLTTTDPGVGMYVDDVYIARSVGSLLNVTDLERIEVLRGPQGTLYGKNTIGGAIKVITQKPTQTNESNLSLTFGEDQKRQVRIMTNTTLTESTQARIHISTHQQDGYVERPAAGDSLGELNNTAARFALTSDLNNALSLYLSVDVSHNDGTSGAAILVETHELCPSTVNAPFCTDNVPESTAPGQVFLFNNIPNVTTAAGGVAGESHYGDEWINSNNNQSAGTAEAISKTDTWGAQANLTYQLPFAQLHTISAIRNVDSYFSRDADHSPYRIYHTRSDVTHQQLSQEIQLNGDAFQDTLIWHGGIYFLYEDANDNSQIDMASMGIQSGGKDIRNASRAIFLHTEYALLNNLSLISGARATQEVKKYTPTQWITYSVTGTPAEGLVIIPAEENREEYSAISYKLALNYAANTNTHVYTSFNSGFKSGGFVQRNQLTKDELPRFKPEKAKTIEIGIHSQLLTNRLHMNAALFHTDYTDIQVRVIELAGFAPITANAAEARIYGAEWDALWAVNNNLQLTTSIGYIDAKYTQISDNLADITTHSKFVDTPKFTSTLGLTYAANLRETHINSHLYWVYTSDVYNDAENTESLKQNATHTLNASIMFTPANTHWQATVGIRNIFDQKEIISGNANRSLGSTVASYSRGRNSYLNLRYNF